MKNYISLFIGLNLLLIATASAKTFTVMSYNLENLFDTAHDANKEDYSYLPLEFKKNDAETQAYCAQMTNEYYKKTCLELDWSQAIVDTKIAQLSKVITSYNSKKGADIVVFQEIENMKIMKELVRRGLKGKGYKYLALTEGPDTRGIDVALISRYKILKTKYHQIDMSEYSDRTTRGILEVTLLIGTKRVTVFANHWPSQGNVDGTRLKASEVLRKAALKSRSDIVIATGDFNTLHDDMPHGINTNILPIFEDVEVKARKIKKVKASGTHWYRGEWASLDKIFVLKKEKD